MPSGGQRSGRRSLQICENTPHRRGQRVSCACGVGSGVSEHMHCARACMHDCGHAQTDKKDSTRAYTCQGWDKADGRQDNIGVSVLARQSTMCVPVWPLPLMCGRGGSDEGRPLASPRFAVLRTKGHEEPRIATTRLSLWRQRPHGDADPQDGRQKWGGGPVMRQFRRHLRMSAGRPTRAHIPPLATTKTPAGGAEAQGR